MREWTEEEEGHLYTLFVEDGWTYAHIAEEMDIPVEEVRKKGQKMRLWYEVKYGLAVAAVKKALRE